MKAYGGSGDVPPRLLYFLYYMCRWVVNGQLHSRLPYPRRKVARYSWDRGLASPRSSLDAVEKIYLLPLPAVESQFFGYVGRSLITIPT
jgi:hypothetical protein